MATYKGYQLSDLLESDKQLAQIELDYPNWREKFPSISAAIKWHTESQTKVIDNLRKEYERSLEESRNSRQSALTAIDQLRARVKELKEGNADLLTDLRNTENRLAASEARLRKMRAALTVYVTHQGTSGSDSRGHYCSECDAALRTALSDQPTPQWTTQQSDGLPWPKLLDGEGTRP